MARIVMATYMVRYPLGGMLSWALQYCLGLDRLGHDVILVEKATYPKACFDPERKAMTDDCRVGYASVKRLLSRFGLEEKLIFRDFRGMLYGSDERQLANVFRDADLLIDIGNHGAWADEAAQVRIPTVLIEGEPGFTQIKMVASAAAGKPVPEFDYYYSNGANIGTSRTTAPSAGHEWRHVFNPINTDLFPVTPPPHDAPFSTVMNWQSHAPLNFDGRSYGQKDIEFAKFIDLPKRVSVPLEVAAAGKVPYADLAAHGWRVREAHEVTASYDGYHSYLAASLGEFSVCKNIFVATQTAWFSDRSAAYLARGRPVVLQDTGFSDYLPCGRGLFAVNNVEEATAAMTVIKSDYQRHSRWARELAEEYLDARKLMGRVVDETMR